MQKLSLLLVLTMLMIPLAVSAQSPDSADKLLSQAQTTATQQHKVVMVVFTASWCSLCRQFETYLDLPNVRPIFDKYFVISRINALEELGKHPERNNPGSTKLLKKLGGGDSVPFFAFLGESGKVIVDSRAPKAGNVGFPVAPEEVDWFMKMVHEAAPSMTPDELNKLESPLRNSKTQH